MGRAITLSELSSKGTNTLGLANALKHPDRARAVEVSGMDAGELRALRRIFRLDLRGTTMPPFIGELRHLRSLTSRDSTLKTVPEAVFRLPHLTTLFLEGTALEDLPGLEHAPALTDVVFRNTPLAEDAATREKILARVAEHGWQASRIFKTSGFSRRALVVPSAPTEKAALVRSINGDTLPAGTSLTKVDLSGETFEDLLVDFDLSGANLAGTTWRRCDFHWTKMAGSDLTGAVFEDCVFDTTKMGEAKLAGAVFRRCAIDIDLTSADLQKARFVELEGDPRMDLEKADARGMELTAETCSESELYVRAPGADLRGAVIAFDVDARRRADIEGTPKARVKWAEIKREGAKEDETTRITYAPLRPEAAKAPKKKAAKEKPKPTVKPADHVGRIDASNAMLWLLAMDAEAAAAWKGEDQKEFNRAMDIDSGEIDAGAHRGVLAQVGDCGGAHVWRVDNGDLVVVEHRGNGHYYALSKDEQIAALGERVASFAVPAEKTPGGKLTVTSGLLALMLPYRNGDFSAAQLAGAKEGAKEIADDDGSRLLVAVANGDYELVSYPFAEDGFEDEIGTYGHVTRIVKATAEAKAPAASSRARRFELVEGASSKFWEIQLEGTSFTTRFGRIGTAGQAATKSWPDADKARKEHDKLVAEKTKKGYLEVAPT